MKKRILAILMIFTVAAVLGVFYFFIKNQAPTMQAREFAGQLRSVEGNTLYIKGTYVNSQYPELQASSNIKDVQVTVDENVKLNRTVTFIPISMQNNAKHTFTPSQLKTEVQKVNISTLIADKDKYPLGITVKTTSNIYGLTSFNATEITYQLPMINESVE